MPLVTGAWRPALPPRRPDPRAQRIETFAARRWAGPALFAVVASAYLGITELVLWLNEPLNGGAGLWPAAGLTLAVLLLVPVRSWGWVVAAIAVAELGGDLSRGYGLGVSLGWTVGNCVEPLVGALLLRRFGNPGGALVPLPQLLRFLLLGVVVGPLVGGSIGSAATSAGFGVPFWQVWPSYVIGDALGVLIVAPALLALGARTARRRTEVVSLAMVSLLVTLVAFVPDAWWTQSVGLLLVPCLTWAALRFGVRGTAWMSVVVTLVANTATTLGNGPFATGAGAAAGHGLTSLQASLAIMVASALLLAAAVDDLSDRRQVERVLHHQATHDHLTGLPNRARLAAALERAPLQGSAPGATVGVLLCDVDHLKAVNDTHGHAGGDVFLTEVARRLAGALLPGEEVARVGGDEFLVLVEAAGPADLDATATRLSAAVHRPLLLSPGTLVTPSLSIGVAMSDGVSSGETIVSHADQALYQAKQGGRGRVEHFDDRLRLVLRERQLIEDELPTALQDGQISCVHQPEVDLATGRVVAFETLARWHHPTRGTVPPDRFVPVAETAGHSAALFAAVLDQSLSSQQAWGRELGFRPAVAVNVSAPLLEDLRLVDDVTAALARHGGSPGTLWLEVTETASAEPGALLVLHALHDMGVRLAVDDFGTGWSSMARLGDYPWDVIKLDCSFISPLGKDPRAEHLVRTMVALAHALGMRTVAEGVETHEQLDRVRELGCDVAQGFLFGRPVPPDEAVALVDGSGRWTGTMRTRADHAAAARGSTTW